MKALDIIFDDAKLASMNLMELQSKAGAAEALLKALANRNRLIILCELLKGERSVTELVSAVGLSQSALSQHLARLRQDALVTTRRDAQTIHYSLSSDRVSRLIALLYELYCAPARETKKPPQKAEARRTL
jgi:ArsR family transcriptional regulator, virulence genes transcriptional regulator